GAQGDRKQLDGAVSLDEWRGENWRAWATREKDHWTLELFFPWSDLERKAEAGDVWMFNLVRYGYATGAFKGVSWALGGSYARPGYFGYLYFGTSKPAAREEIAALLNRKASAPWSVAIGEEIIFKGDEGKPPRIEK